VNAIQAQVYGLKVGTPADNLEIGIYALDGSGNPTGSALTSATLAGGSITTSAAWLTVTFSAAEELAPGQYGLQISRSGAADGSNYYQIYTNVTGYSGGALRYWNGSAWVNPLSNGDALFVLLVDNAVNGMAQINELVDTYGEFIQSQVIEVAVGSTPVLPSYRDGDTTVMAEVLALMQTGTTNDRRIECRIDENRVAVWSEEPAAGDAAYLILRDGMILDSNGTPLPLSNPPYGGWAKIADVPEAPDSSLIMNANMQYIAGVEWSQDSGWSPEFRADQTISQSVGGGANLGEIKPYVMGWTSECGSYTPTPRATTTDPTLGNGTLMGSYCKRGPFCKVQIYFVLGSTSSAGSGTWYFPLPFAANPLAPGATVGVAKITNAGVANYVGMAYIDSSGYIRVAIDAGGDVAATNPFGFGTSDYIVIDIEYLMA
jgi:hypothetical protein